MPHKLGGSAARPNGSRYLSFARITTRHARVELFEFDLILYNNYKPLRIAELNAYQGAFCLMVKAKICRPLDDAAARGATQRLRQHP